MRRIATMFAMLLTIAAFALSPAQQPQPKVVWTASIDSVSPTQGTLVLHADIVEGFHIYGMEKPANLDFDLVTTALTVEPAPGLELQGPVKASAEPMHHIDMMFNAEIPWWEDSITLRQDFVLEKGTPGARINAQVEYMACNASSCTPATTEEFNLTFGKPAAQQAEPQPEAPAIVEAAASTDSGTAKWWVPVESNMAQTESTAATDMNLFSLLIMGFLGGLLALLTPCVWPMIPMTVSFFLKTNKSRKKSISNAIIYGLSIVVIFVLLGLAITIIFGAGKLNELATSAIFNIIFFLLLVLFGVSFLGAFEIKLPSSWANKLDETAENTTGIISIFFMAFTLVLVSFSCTGPIIGTLLVEAAASANITGPLMGMLGFSLGLALPFALFAIFPSFLNSMPKSGGWLNSVKVVLGFIELILSLKFLSVADLAYGWRILDREVFISIWIVLFTLLGLYLLGKLRFSHDSEQKHTSLLGFFLAVVSFSFAVYLLPGLWGAPLKVTSAFTPPLSTQDFNLYGGEFREYYDFEEGMQYAKENGKPVMIDFTGYGCVNCRKMEMAVFDKQKVKSAIENDYVLIKLYVDDKEAIANPYTVEQYGKQKTIKTVGDKWTYLQTHKFGISAQPYYVILDNDGNMIMPSREYNEDVEAFAQWLADGVEAYNKTK